MVKKTDPTALKSGAQSIPHLSYGQPSKSLAILRSQFALPQKPSFLIKISLLKLLFLTVEGSLKPCLKAMLVAVEFEVFLGSHDFTHGSQEESIIGFMC